MDNAWIKIYISISDIYITYSIFISIEQIFILTLGARNIRDITFVCISNIDIDIRLQNDLTTHHQILFHFVIAQL